MIFSKKPYYRYKTGRQIWRLLLSEKSKLLIEERGGDKTEVFFNIIDVGTKTLLLESLQLEEMQWAGVDHLTDKYIFFHKYVKPDLPHHVGIMLYSIEDKKIIWKDENRVFEFFIDNRICCSSQGTFEKLHFLLKIDEGNIVEDNEIDLTTFHRIRNEKNQQELTSDYLFPEVTDISDERVEKILINNKIDLNRIAGDIEFIKFKNYLILTYHVKVSEDLYNCELLMFDLEKEAKVVSEVLGNNLKTLFFDSFFIKGNFLYLLKGKKEIAIYDL